MDVLQVIRERRSIRKYKPDTVSAEDLNILLEAARWAPSWANSQCWRLIIVRDPEIKAALAATLKTLSPGGRNRATDAVLNAPIVIVACAERELSGFTRSADGKRTPLTDKGEWWFMFDVALAMQNLTLAAHALGLGTVHIGLFDSQKAAQVLGVPENLAVVEIMPLGYPDEQPPARPRKPLNEIVYYDKYPSR